MANKDVMFIFLMTVALVCYMNAEQKDGGSLGELWNSVNYILLVVEPSAQ